MAVFRFSLNLFGEKSVGDLYSHKRLLEGITGFRAVVALDSDKWYLFHNMFSIVNYILTKKNKRADTELAKV